MLQIGQLAPNFTADAVVGEEFKKVSLADYKGKWVVLFFYPLDFTFVCPTEITAFSDNYGQFRELGAEILGVSVDSKFSHLAWIKTSRKEGGLERLNFPLVADLSKQISRDYEVLLDAGIALRGVFIIDPTGKLRYKAVHDLGIGRNTEEIARVLAAIQEVDKTGEVCPANWKPGGKKIKPDPTKSKEYFGSVGR
ncbi:MAG: peroxiredoxin [Deltaproteobacteria bacterium]|nr:peroxiredoxin [Deltaproteobacteria bacterium]MBI2500365.1 peroxiredoxin [Deltaproteobacteria bacterium]MBI4196225.1 peroxiredoxin [Deltaproteobacteria bacterium]